MNSSIDQTIIEKMDNKTEDIENMPIITRPTEVTPSIPPYQTTDINSLKEKHYYDDISSLLLPPPTPPTPQNVNESSTTPSHRNIRVLIIGYYYHNDIGNDQYMDVFKYILQSTPDIKYKLKFVNCENLVEIIFKKTDIVIIGGGNILNNTFLTIINDVFKNKGNLIIAVSAGIPARNILVNTNKMDIIDYLFVRSKQERDILNEFYPSDRITYLPDLSYFMTNIAVLNVKLPTLQRFSFGNRHVIPSDSSILFSFNDLRTVLNTFKKIQKRKIIGVCLNKHVFINETNGNYQLIIKEFALFIGLLLNKGYVICFLPFNIYSHPVKDQSLNTSIENIQQKEYTKYNDILIHNDVCHELTRICSGELCKNIINIQQRLYSKETFEILGFFHFTVSMHFHSTLFSIYNNIPFLPIYAEKEIRNLLLDIDYPSFLKYDLNENDTYSESTTNIPILINNKILRNKMLYLLENNRSVIELTKYLKNVCQHIQTDLSTSIPLLLDIIVNKNDTNDKLKTYPPNTSTITLSQRSNDSLHFNKKEDALKEMVSFAKLKLKLNNYCEGVDFRRVTDPNKQKLIVSIVSFYLTGGDIHSIFCDELNRQMFYSNNGGFDYNYIIEWGEIIKKNLVCGGSLPLLLTNQSTPPPPPPPPPHTSPHITQFNSTNVVEQSVHRSQILMTNSNKSNINKIKELYLPESTQQANIPQFNIHYFNQKNKNGECCSGWNYLYNELQKYHTNDTDATILDMYIERTFKWEKECLKAVGIIPYRKKWRGFIHHSFNTHSSTNIDLLQTPEFVESLPFCECIYVFSKRLEIQLKFELSKIGWNSLSVVSLIQPTETNFIVPFCYSAFLENDEKRILHVGGQLVNTFIFYQLQIPQSTKVISNKTFVKWAEFFRLKQKTQVSFIKTVLINVNDEKFYLSYRIKNFILNELTNVNPSLSNNWNKHIYNFFDNLTNGVEKNNNLKNEEYNELLSKNIVFLHLEDVSTINTVIDCCVRNCPFFVNRHPDVVELVGDKYPLFYDIDSTKSDATNFFEINKQLEEVFKDPSIIYKTYKYLSSLDKTRFHIGKFIDRIK